MFKEFRTQSISLLRADTKTI